METDSWDPLDHPALRTKIEEGTVAEWQRLFPLDYGSVSLHAQNVRLTGRPRFSKADQRKAFMENRTLSRPLKADLELYDKESGDLLDKREAVTLMHVPYYADNGVFVHNGTNYTGTIQGRLIPGAYTRRQSNGGLETQFNVRAATGRVFRVGLDQESGQFRLRAAGSDLHLYSILNGMGVPDEALAEAWGPEVLAINKEKFDTRALGKAYGKLVPRYEQAADDDDEKRAQKLVAAFEKAQLAQKTVARTLGGYWKPVAPLKTAGLVSRLVAARLKTGAAFDIRSQMGDVDDEGDAYQPVGADGLVAATRKLLAVSRGEDAVDERDAPAFLKLYPMDKLMRERIRLDAGKLRRNLMRMVASRRNLSPISHRVFDPYYVEVITKHPTTTPIEETNPLHGVGQHRRVTRMGPGGIGSDDAITPEMQAVQASEFGFFSPIEGPESGRAGVDQRLSWGIRIGSDGRVRRPLWDARQSREVMVSPEDLYDKVVKLPD